MISALPSTTTAFVATESLAAGGGDGLSPSPTPPLKASWSPVGYDKAKPYVLGDKVVKVSLQAFGAAAEVDMDLKVSLVDTSGEVVTPLEKYESRPNALFEVRECRNCRMVPEQTWTLKLPKGGAVAVLGIYVRATSSQYGYRGLGAREVDAAFTAFAAGCSLKGD
jgi:hypothetical protein